MAEWRDVVMEFAKLPALLNDEKHLQPSVLCLLCV